LRGHSPREMYLNWINWLNWLKLIKSKFNFTFSVLIGRLYTV
jgi:hypothetical protein